MRAHTCAVTVTMTTVRWSRMSYVRGEGLPSMATEAPAPGTPEAETTSSWASESKVAWKLVTDESGRRMHGSQTAGGSSIFHSRVSSDL